MHAHSRACDLQEAEKEIPQAKTESSWSMIPIVEDEGVMHSRIVPAEVYHFSDETERYRDDRRCRRRHLSPVAENETSMQV